MKRIHPLFLFVSQCYNYIWDFCSVDQSFNDFLTFDSENEKRNIETTKK